MIGVAELASGQGSAAITVMLVSMMSIALVFTSGFAAWNTFARRGTDPESTTEL